MLYYIEKWNTMYQKFEEYSKKNGTTNVPVDYVTEDGYQLGTWVVYQRSRRRNGMLPEDQEKLLNRAFMIWNLNDEKWNVGYDKLIEYYEQYGDVNVAPSYQTEDGYKLGQWTASLKQGYKGRGKRKLDQNQIMLLNDLEIDWSARDTRILNSEIVRGCCFSKYRKIMLERMKNILSDLSYEMDGNITDKEKQKALEMEIIKRMWR